MTKKTELCNLAFKYHSDKCPALLHGYTPFYHELLKDKRNDVKKVLEIGIGCPETMEIIKGYKTGASLFMWRDYFPNAEIFGVDILDSALVNGNRIKSFKCDQSNNTDLISLKEKIGNDFDLIVDDGSHKAEDQVFSLIFLFPCVKEGGIYVIEDIKDLDKLVEFLKINNYNYEVKLPPNPVSIYDRMIIIKKEEKKKITLAMTSWPKSKERIEYIRRTIESLEKNLIVPGFEIKKILSCESDQVSEENIKKVESLGWPVVWRHAAPSLGMHFNDLFGSLTGIVMLVEDDCYLSMPLNITPGIELIESGQEEVVRYWTCNNNLLVKEGVHFTYKGDTFVHLGECLPNQFVDRQLYSDRPFLTDVKLWKRIGQYKSFSQHEFDMDWRFKEFKVQVAVRLPSVFWHIGIDTLYKGKIWPDTYDVSKNTIEGMMLDNELLWLFNTALGMNSFLEIGSWMGRSTHAILSGCRGKVHSVDHFLGSADPIETGNRDVFPQFFKNVGAFNNLIIHKKSSLEAAKEFEDGSLDCVFIDGGHQYHEVVEDIRAWKPKARKILCGHDYQSGPVRKSVADELGEVKVYERIWWVELEKEPDEELLPGVSIVIPNLGRPEKLKACLEAIKKNAGYPVDKHEVIVQDDDFKDRQGAPKTLMAGVAKAKHDLIMFLGNDTIPKKFFLLEAVKKMLEVFPDQDGLVGLNDEFWNGDLSAHWLVSKKILNKYFCTDYHHICCDNELVERCKLMGKYTWAERAKIYHDHPEATGKSDEVYALGYEKKKWDEDFALWKQRSEKLGFPMRHYSKKEVILGGFTRYDVNLKPRIMSLDWCKNIEDYKVLNVGVGDGSGGLAKQLPILKFKQLNHLDVEESYFSAAKKLKWATEKVNFIAGDIRDFDFSDYDLVFLFDILEHLPKEDSLKIIEKLKRAIIFIPLEKHFRKNLWGVKAQDHLSLWTEEDFKSRGFKTEILPNFHQNELNEKFHALWATKYAKQ